MAWFYAWTPIDTEGQYFNTYGDKLAHVPNQVLIEADSPAEASTRLTAIGFLHNIHDIYNAVDAWFSSVVVIAPIERTLPSGLPAPAAIAHHDDGSVFIHFCNCKSCRESYPALADLR